MVSPRTRNVPREKSTSLRSYCIVDEAAARAGRVEIVLAHLQAAMASRYSSAAPRP